MSRQQQILWAIVLVIVLVGAYWWWSTSQSATPQSASVQSAGSNAPMIPAASAPSQAASSAPMSATVTFNGSGFSPANVTIAQGGTVNWVSSAGNIWVASDPHPTHNGYDGTTQEQHCVPNYTGPAPFDQCIESTTFSFTFNKVGTWGYHDHLDTGARGTVTVVATQ